MIDEHVHDSLDDLLDLVEVGKPVSDEKADGQRSYPGWEIINEINARLGEQRSMTARGKRRLLDILDHVGRDIQYSPADLAYHLAHPSDSDVWGNEEEDEFDDDEEDEWEDPDESYTN